MATSLLAMAKQATSPLISENLANDSVPIPENISHERSFEQSDLQYTYARPSRGKIKEYNKRAAKEIAEGDEGDASAGLSIHSLPAI
jgi:hypothetical protein